MARKVVYVSDLSNRELDEKEAVKITVTFQRSPRHVRR